VGLASRAEKGVTNHAWLVPRQEWVKPEVEEGARVRGGGAQLQQSSRIKQTNKQRALTVDSASLSTAFLCCPTVVDVLQLHLGGREATTSAA
jgi:hypothetical protein